MRLFGKQNLSLRHRPTAAALAAGVLMSLALTAGFSIETAYAGQIAGAKMDAQTHTVVIEKLEMSLKKAGEDETIDLSPVRSRLADLYSDRARLREMEENEKSCTKCTGAKEDRQRALQLYTLTLKEAPQKERGAIMIHMAHLYQLNGEAKRSEALLEQIIKEGTRAHNNEVLSKAYVGRAERRYNRGLYTYARQDFEVAIKMAAPTKRGPIAHRIAWCNLNLEQQDTAVAQLVAILKNPAMLKRESTEGAAIDIAFQEEVAMDLATFVARGPVSSRDIALVEDLAPKRQKLEILRHLAQETERLGKPRAALEAWALAATYEPEGAKKLEVHVRVARLRYNIGDKQGSLAAINDAMKLWNKENCTEKVDCENLRKDVKNLIADWNKAETKQPTALLLGAYKAYLTAFDDDVEMTYFAAETAKATKAFTDAVALYHKSSLLAVNSKNPKAPEILESSITNEVEMAEQAPKPQQYELRQAAYDHYLKLSPKGKINHQVRYQRARLPYEQGANDEASHRLQSFATSTNCTTAKGSDRALCVQAADLDLDARVLMKDDVSVEKGALLYARVYGERKLDYLKIARTSAMNQAKTMEPKAALEKLANINTLGMQREEQILLLKNRIALAEKAKELGALKVAASQLLKMPKIDAKDKEMALSRLAWVAEMSFDFGQAYALTKQMEMRQLKADDRELRLAMFAELAGKNSRAHEEKFLQLSRSAQKRAVVRAKLVRTAKNQARELAKHEAELSRFPQIYAPLVLEIYSKTGDRRFAEQKLKNRALAKQPAGKLMARQLFLTDFNKVESKIAAHQIRSRSDAQMQRSLAERIKLLGEVEVQAAKAIKTGDWTAQAVTLAVLSRENNRMYSDVLALPVPKRLKGQERVQYTQLVEGQANVYLQKHQAIDQKLQAFWNDGKSFDSMVEEFETARPEMRRLMAREMKTLAKVAPGDRQSKLNSALNQGVDMAGKKEVASATQDARKSPFSEGRLAKLRELESSRGSDTMVAYLDARMTKLKEESKQ